MVSNPDAIIVGAGPAGLACAGTMRAAGLNVTVFEKAGDVGAAWRRHYDRLHLHTDRNHSGLLGMAMSRDYPAYPSCEQMIAYSTGILLPRVRYCRHFGNTALMHQGEGQQRTEQERVAELDGVRALAILLVVIWHYLGAVGGPESIQWKIFIVGRTGVDLFFVLSGYLITGILLNNASASNYFSAFYARRSLRILPIYFGMVAIYLAGRQLGGTGLMLFGGTLPWWSYIFGVQNIWMTIQQTYGASWLAATWSLAVEEQFYLLFPLVVYFTAPRTLLQILIALLVLCPIGRIVAQVLGDGFGYYVLMPLRADILAVGALIALLKFSSGAVSQPTRRAVQIAFWLIASFFPVFAWAVEKSDFNMAVWGHTYLVAFYGLAVFMVLDNKGARPLALLRSRAAAFLARISYALYLVHGPVLILTFLAAHLSPTVHTASGVLLTACAFAISIAICSASYLLVERPFIRIAHERFRYVGSKAKAYGFSAR